MNPLALLRTMRPQQWVKNVFVLAALFFSWGERGGELELGEGAVVSTLLAFAAFCLGSSAIYLLNDVVDVEADRAHPVKRHRPIPAGELSIRVALAAAVACVAGSLGLGWLAGGEPVGVVALVAGYMALNLTYSLKLKHVVLVDAFCIAAGFVLRVVAGGVAARAEISHWLLLCTLFLALFLALSKRRAETDRLGDERGATRQTLVEYNAGFLDQMVTVLAACTILTYTMYTVAPETAEKFGEGHHLEWTVPFVVFGLGRYMLLVQTQRGGESPTRVLLGGDLMFALNTLGWLVVVAQAVF